MHPASAGCCCRESSPHGGLSVMKQVGLIGWRGMVGSVLMQRMREENDFASIDPVFFTTSNVGSAGPDIGKDIPALKDAYDLDALKPMDIRSEEHTSELQS